MLCSAHTVERAKKKAPCGGLSAAVFCCLRCRADRADFPYAHPRPVLLFGAHRCGKGPAFVFCHRFKNSPGKPAPFLCILQNPRVCFALFPALSRVFYSVLLPCPAVWGGEWDRNSSPHNKRAALFVGKVCVHGRRFSISRCVRCCGADDFGVGEDRGLLAAGVGSVFFRRL